MTARVVLAEYWVSDDETILFIGREDLAEPHVEHIPVGREALAKAVSIGIGREDVYGPLVAPIPDWTEPGDLVWIVPHDVLHQVALHALALPDGQPLIARNSVSYTPSASAMPYIRARGARALSSAVVYADSRADRPLLHAGAQGTILRQILGDNAVAVTQGAEVTRAAVERSLSTADIVHIACHGEFDQDHPLASGFLLTDPDGRFTAEDFLGAHLNAGLVTLSACESGVNQLRAGDELIGLTRAILYAGAASVVVSLWSVDEISTSILMRGFYTALKAGQGKAAALREAQLSLREMTVTDAIGYCTEIRQDGDSGLLDRDIADLRFIAKDFAAALEGYQRLAAHGADPELASAITRCRRALRAGPTPDYDLRPYADPYFWAPFVLMGDWR